MLKSSRPTGQHRSLSMSFRVLLEQQALAAVSSVGISKMIHRWLASANYKKVAFRSRESTDTNVRNTFAERKTTEHWQTVKPCK